MGPCQEEVKGGKREGGRGGGIFGRGNRIEERESCVG